jgi:valyl-tRNA synthetase
MSDFPKQYDPKISEKQVQALWEREKCSTPKESRTGNTFYIPIPPPNVTGNLHIGHALTLTLEDIMTRYHRMKGDSTLWIPGTDHAGIATQAKVEERVMKSGSSRHELGRENFLGECWKWIDEYGGNIQNQMKKMWASVSWEHERFTLDEKSNALVENIFVDLYNKWLIYRGEYMVNYSPALESVISDIEVEHIEVEEKMYYINYFVAGSDNELLIATTRPETLLGDQAVMVHPKDKRYKKLIGRNVILPIVNKEIPIIADETVDMEFGTGVVKVTPAHDPTDFEVAKRHGLKTNYQVIEKNGIMGPEAWIFAWQNSVTEARSNIVELLRSKGNLVKIEPYTHKVGFCSRGNCRVESVVSTQWFVRANKMAEKVIAWYKKKEFEILPERFNKTFEDWIFNLRDWCISRQLWWGHQIPAYYHKDTGELIGVGRDINKIVEDYNKGISASQILSEADLRRDDDVLDTWFSSALWPFSVLDWTIENPGEFFKNYYPANVLETGYDILFFWVIRMFLMGYEYTGQTPFKTIYLHGLVFDSTGRKMSKSWGNVVDPLTVIDEYSTDALRMSCVIGNTPGNNLNFSTDTVKEYSLFLNKFWNIARFIWMNIWNITDDRDTIIWRIKDQEEALLPYEKWILSRLAYTQDTITESMENYNFSIAGSELMSFIRDEFADFAIEAYKVEKERSILGRDVMSICILDILALFHPYAPHITEALYQEITEQKNQLMNAQWPDKVLPRDKDAEIDMNRIFDIVRTIRNLRAENHIKPGELRDVAIVCPDIYRQNIESNSYFLIGLTKIGTLSISKKPVKHSEYAYGVVGNIEIYVDAHIDAEKTLEEQIRLREQIENKKDYIRVLKTKLSNSQFVKNAPEKVVRIEMDKLHTTENELAKLEEKYKSLGGE